MRLRTRYMIFIILIHLLTLVLSFVILKEHKILFIASEFIILLSLFFAFRLYYALVNPLQLLLQGVDAIKDRDFNVKFLKTGKYEMDQLIDVYNHMIDELRKERRQQQEQHYFLEKLIHSSPTGIILLDFEGKIEQLNPTAQQLLGNENWESEKVLLSELQNPLAQELAQLSAGKAKVINIGGVQSLKCQKSHFMDRGFQRHFILLEDLTAELLRTEKQAYAKVIRMMAHEVNNSVGPINSILDSTLFYKDQLQAEQQAPFYNAIEVAKQRNLRLNKFMRNFADVVRLPKAQKETLDIRESLESVVTLFKAEAKNHQIELGLNLPKHPVLLSYDPQQIDQALVNIIKNAIESIQENGQIIVSYDPENAEVIISDNGPGIPTTIQQQLFQPFFSGKKMGQGIGLTLTREILFQHGFQFGLRTEEDGWTRFRIQFR